MQRHGGRKEPGMLSELQVFRMRVCVGSDPGRVGDEVPEVIRGLAWAGLEDVKNWAKTMNSLLRAAGSHGRA